MQSRRGSVPWLLATTSIRLTSYQRILSYSRTHGTYLLTNDPTDPTRRAEEVAWLRSLTWPSNVVAHRGFHSPSDLDRRPIENRRLKTSLTPTLSLSLSLSLSPSPSRHAVRVVIASAHQRNRPARAACAQSISRCSGAQLATQSATYAAAHRSRGSAAGMGCPPTAPRLPSDCPLICPPTAL